MQFHIYPAGGSLCHQNRFSHRADPEGKTNPLYSFYHSINKYVLSTYYVPRTREAAVVKHTPLLPFQNLQLATAVELNSNKLRVYTCKDNLTPFMYSGKIKKKKKKNKLRGPPKKTFPCEPTTTMKHQDFVRTPNWSPNFRIGCPLEQMTL